MSCLCSLNILFFVEAVKKGNSEIVKPYFYEKANFYGQLNENKYQSGSIKVFMTHCLMKNNNPVLIQF